MNKQRWASFVNHLENNGHNRYAKKIFFVLSFCFFPWYFLCFCVFFLPTIFMILFLLIFEYPLYVFFFLDTTIPLRLNIPTIMVSSIQQLVIMITLVGVLWLQIFFFFTSYILYRSITKHHLKEYSCLTNIILRLTQNKNLYIYRTIRIIQTNVTKHPHKKQSKNIGWKSGTLLKSTSTVIETKY